ncbi:MAG: FUN14 domain-containing protein, partial [Planctomycetota bacterium]
EDAGDGGGEVSVDTGATGALQAPGFAPGGAPPGGTAAATEDTGPGGLDAWSPTIFKLGFSFFIGFCIGFAVRTFLKISVVAIGIIALAAFGLQYAGIIDVNWDAVSGHYDSVLDWLKDQTSSFTGFVQGHLPSAGLAAFGLVAGFRKR